MSSTLQHTLANLQQNDYVTLAILTAIGYDYVLAFSKEMDYIWLYPWTWVSTLFVLVRYAGICSFVIPVLRGSSFLPGPEKFSDKIIIILNEWAFFLFLGAADLVMTLRVWVMYNQSKLVLVFLLAIFILEMISYFLIATIDSDPGRTSPARHPIAADTWKRAVSLCTMQLTSAFWQEMGTILQVIHGAAMCSLTTFRFVQESLQIGRMQATKQWRIGQYTSLLVKQGILYFFAVFLFAIMNVLGALGKFPTEGRQMVPALLLEYVPLFTLTPRFILSIRELHARDVEGRCSGGVDTGFGLSSCSGISGSAAVLVDDIGQGEGMEGVEEMQRVV